MAIFVVDSVRRLSMEVTGAIIRLSKSKFDPVDYKLNQLIKDGTFSDEKF